MPAIGCTRFAVLGQGLVSNPAAIVMCNEIIGYVKRFVRGLDLSREKIGLEVIRQVGPGGHYLTQAHTKAHFAAELWAPPLLNRDSPDSWAKRGSPSYEEVVTRRAREILASHQPRPLPAEASARLEAIARRAEEALAEVQFVL